MASFDLPLLESFVVLADELHFGRAADRLHVAQPALSRRIARLEAQLGLTLAERDTRGVRLTPAGLVLAARGRAALDALRRGTAAARSLPAAHGLSLAWNGATELLMSPIVGRARAQAPTFELDYRGLVDQVAVRAVHIGDADLALTFGRTVESDPDLHLQPLMTVENGIVLPDGHPLLRRERLTATDLDDMDLAILPRHLSPPFHDFLVSRLRTATTTGRTTEVVLEAHYAHDALVRAVIAGAGFGPACRAVFERLAPTGVHYRSIDPPILNDIYGVVRRDARPDVVAFVALLRRTVDADPDLLPPGCVPYTDRR